MSDLRDAVVEWAEARRATTDASVFDVRKDETFRAKLDRLANAEQNLILKIDEVVNRQQQPVTPYQPFLDICLLCGQSVHGARL